MYKLISKVEASINQVDLLIEEEKFNQALFDFNNMEKFIEMNINYISETNLEERIIIAKFYSKYAYFLFSFYEYDLFFEKYVKAQKYGYDSEKRKEFIYNSFIEPNIEELKFNFNYNINIIFKYGFLHSKYSFEELQYFLLPNGINNEYYIYDKKNNIIHNKISFSNLEKKVTINNQQLDKLCILNGELYSFLNILEDLNLFQNNYYIIDSQLSKLLSLFQAMLIDKKILSRLLIFDNIETFEKFLIINNRYLPRTIIADDSNKAKYKELIDKIHKKRIKSLMDKRNNILLSVCIPSFNRGKRAYENIIHLLDSELDEEIEFVVSNNGTKNETSEYYQKIKKIKDSRIVYFEFEDNMGMALNFCKVVEIASGKFVLLLSDEDLVDIYKLNEIICLLKDKSEGMSMVRVKTNFQSFVPYFGIIEKGKNAFIKFMLTSNYMSGNIYNRELLINNGLTKFISNNLDNEACYYYPHMVWDLFMYQYGSVLGMDIILIKEGAAETTNFEVKRLDNKLTNVPYYATIEGRLKQHEGFYYVIIQLEIIKNNFDFLREIYRKLCSKTIYLVSLSIKTYYNIDSIKKKDILYEVKGMLIKNLIELHDNKNTIEYKEDYLFIHNLLENLY